MHIFSILLMQRWQIYTHRMFFTFINCAVEMRRYVSAGSLLWEKARASFKDLIGNESIHCNTPVSFYGITIE